MIFPILKSITGFSLTRKHIIANNMNGFYILSILYAVFMMLSMITSYRFINMLNISTSATCIFFIGICFVIVNIVTENYNSTYAKRMIFIGIMSIGIGMLMIEITNLISAPIGKEKYENAYAIVFKNEFTHVYICNALAALIGFNSTSSILFFLKKIKANIILRILIADFLGEFLFTLTVISLIMIPIGETWEVIISMTITSFVFKLIFSLICSTIILPISEKVITWLDGSKYQPCFMEK